MIGECWVKIDGVSVSSDGRVITLQKELLTDAELSPDRQHATLATTRKGVEFLDRLICLAFNGQPPAGKPLVRHLNGDVRDCRAANLIWGDQRDSLLDRGSDLAGRFADIDARLDADIGTLRDPALGMPDFGRGRLKTLSDFGLHDWVSSDPVDEWD